MASREALGPVNIGLAGTPRSPAERDIPALIALLHVALGKDELALRVAGKSSPSARRLADLSQRRARVRPLAQPPAFQESFEVIGLAPESPLRLSVWLEDNVVE